MRSKVTRLIASTILLGIMTFPGTALARPKAPRPPAKPAQPQAARRERGGERHPEIRAAIRALERAKQHLQNAAHDFGGHRVEALEAVNRAIEQLQMALKYDKD